MYTDWWALISRIFQFKIQVFRHVRISALHGPSPSPSLQRPEKGADDAGVRYEGVHRRRPS